MSAELLSIITMHPNNQGPAVDGVGLQSETNADYKKLKRFKKVNAPRSLEGR